MGDLNTAECKRLLEDATNIAKNTWKRTRKWGENKFTVRTFKNTVDATEAWIVDEGNGNVHTMPYNPDIHSFAIDLASLSFLENNEDDTINVVTNFRITEQEPVEDYENGFYFYRSGKSLQALRQMFLHTGVKESPAMLINSIPWASFTPSLVSQYWKIIDGSINVRDIAGLGWTYEIDGEVNGDNESAFFVQPIDIGPDEERMNDQQYPFNLDGFYELMECVIGSNTNTDNEKELERIGFVKAKSNRNFY